MGIGYREDLSKDALTNLDPADSYFVKKCGRLTCSLRHDWLTDNLPTTPTTLPSGAPSGTQQVGVVLLSTDWTFNTTVARKRFFNQTEYIFTPWKIAQSAERAAQLGFVAGGIESEIANEVERQNKYLGKILEFIMLSAQAEVVDDDSSNIGKCSGFFDSANWNANSGATIPLSWNAEVLPNQAGFNGLGQDQVEALLLSMYNNGAMGPQSAYMSPTFQATIAATWTGRPGYQVQQQVSEHAIDNQVHTYWSRSPIGQVDFIADRTIQNSACIALVDHRYMQIAEFIPISVREQPLYVSRNHQGVIDWQGTLVDKNPQAHGRIYTTGVTPGA